MPVQRSLEIAAERRRIKLCVPGGNPDVGLDVHRIERRLVDLARPVALVIGRVPDAVGVPLVGPYRRRRLQRDERLRESVVRPLEIQLLGRVATSAEDAGLLEGADDRRKDVLWGHG